MPEKPALNRKEFLQLFGVGAAAILATTCLGGCSSSSISPASNVDFSLDVTDPANADLNNASKGYVYGWNGAVIVVKTVGGTYLAFQAPCPHEGVKVYFRQSQNQFICDRHNSVFSISGARVSGPAPSGLKEYTVTQTGNTLRITG